MTVPGQEKGCAFAAGQFSRFLHGNLANGTRCSLLGAECRDVVLPFLTLIQLAPDAEPRRGRQKLIMTLGLHARVVLESSISVLGAKCVLMKAA